MDPIGSHKVWRRPRLVPVSFGEPKHPKQNFGIVSVDCPLSTHVPQPSGNHEFKTRRQFEYAFKDYYSRISKNLFLEIIFDGSKNCNY